MVRKVGAFVVLSALLFFPLASFGQSAGSRTGTSPDIADIPNDSIVVLSNDTTPEQGYVHQTYVFVDTSCPGGSQQVDYYGPAIDPNSAELHALERSSCTSYWADDMNER